MIADLLIAAAISFLPLLELRGGILYAVAKGVPLLPTFIVCVIVNSLVTLFVFMSLDLFHSRLVMWDFYRKNFDRYVERNRVKLEKHIGTKYEMAFLALFTAIPLPLTGAYTAAILAWVFGLKRMRSFVAISIGVFIAGIIVSLTAMGIIHLL